MVADEKRDNIYRLLPNNATYYFTKLLLPRALKREYTKVIHNGCINNWLLSVRKNPTLNKIAYL
ncbi:hypothetical protein HW49_05550 [Porphyromonadaceae bacterium COT-184 OH4590]|nr:hypothetical protein HW49_05550 [Porphyromonadaceae bacterium COT-184 OH4590]